MDDSLPGSGERMDPWFSEARRVPVSSFSAGTFGATADSSSVFTSRSSARKPSGRRIRIGRIGLGQAVLVAAAAAGAYPGTARRPT